jgi:hypothetical protein
MRSPVGSSELALAVTLIDLHYAQPIGLDVAEHVEAAELI